jgi:hypothetical protein
VLGFVDLQKNVTGSISGLTATVPIDQNLGYIHKLPVNNPFSLSVRGQDLYWPGMAATSLKGWWMAFEDQIDIGSISPADQVAITNAVLSQALGPEGCSMLEFQLFVPSLTHFSLIEEYANRIVQFRYALHSKHGRERSSFEDSFTQQRVTEIFGTSVSFATAKGDLKDYSDSAIRYFRMTDFVYKRGGNTHIDLAPDYRVEIERLLGWDSGRSQAFDFVQSYLDYLVDTSVPTLPWENPEDLRLIISETITMTRSLAGTVHKEAVFDSFLQNISSLTLAKQLEEIKTFKNSLHIEKLFCVIT